MLMYHPTQNKYIGMAMDKFISSHKIDRGNTFPQVIGNSITPEITMESDSKIEITIWYLTDSGHISPIQENGAIYTFDK